MPKVNKVFFRLLDYGQTSAGHGSHCEVEFSFVFVFFIWTIPLRKNNCGTHIDTRLKSYHTCCSLI